MGLTLDLISNFAYTRCWFDISRNLDTKSVLETVWRNLSKPKLSSSGSSSGMQSDTGFVRSESNALNSMQYEEQLTLQKLKL